MATKLVVERGDVLTERICEIFDLEPDKVASLRIVLEAGRPVMLITESVVPCAEADMLATELRRYNLIATDGGTEPERS